MTDAEDTRLWHPFADMGAVRNAELVIDGGAQGRGTRIRVSFAATTTTLAAAAPRSQQRIETQVTAFRVPTGLELRTASQTGGV